MRVFIAPFRLANEVVAVVVSAITTGRILAVLLHYVVLSVIFGGVFSYVFSILYAVIFNPSQKNSIDTALKNKVDFGTFMALPEAKLLIPFALIYLGLSVILPIVGAVHASRIYKEKREGKYQTFGQARYAKAHELKQSGLTGNGVVFGRMDGRLIEKPPQQEGHVLVVGGTGTGKSRGVAIPTLLRWQGAAFVVDIKGELSRLTAQARPGKVYIFDPERGGDAYDPLLEAKTVDGAQELARYLIPEPKSGDTFWAKSAQGILAAASIDGAYKGETLTEVAERLCVTSPERLVEELQGSEIRAVRLLSSLLVGMPEKTLGGVMAELRNKLLTLAADEGIARATARSGWSPATLEEGATVYLRVSEHMLAQYKELWALMAGQIMRHLSKREEKGHPPILLLLDELPRLGVMPTLLDALATLRSRNVHIVSIIQSMAQLDTIYGMHERKVIADNCRYKLVLSATDPETQKYFSDLAGQKTVLSQSWQSDIIKPKKSVSEQGVPLIRPETWAHRKKPILFAPKIQPAEIELAFWDQDKELKRLLSATI